MTLPIRNLFWEFCMFAITVDEKTEKALRVGYRYRGLFVSVAGMGQPEA